MQYLEKATLYPPFSASTPASDLGIVVVIPCYDEPDLLDSLNALFNCNDTISSDEIIIIINDAEDSSKDVKNRNIVTYSKAIEWIGEHSTPKKSFFVYHFTFNNKDAGVGLARKVGMDEAARRFEYLNKDGVIVCFDADSLCERNYLEEIEKQFTKYPKAQGASIYFEHPLNGKYEPCIYEGIIKYELFLRYYCNALRWAGHPFAFQTVGSSMAVKSKIYQKQGGMNKRKAGEDFYFLEKIIPLGNYIEINTTKVIPSPRESGRVPFGTGRAITEWVNTKEYDTYNFKCFIDLKEVLDSHTSIYYSNDIEGIYAQYPSSFKKYVSEEAFVKKIMELKENSSNLKTYRDRFFKWFNLFMVLKYIHFCRDHFYKNVSVYEAINQASSFLEMDVFGKSELDILLKFREKDKSKIY